MEGRSKRMAEIDGQILAAEKKLKELKERISALEGAPFLSEQGGKARDEALSRLTHLTRIIEANLKGIRISFELAMVRFLSGEDTEIEELPESRLDR